MDTGCIPPTVNFFQYTSVLLLSTIFLMVYLLLPAKSYGFGCAWTNEAFGLWFLLHFQYLDVPISRDAYISKLEKLIQKQLNDNSFRYD
ncbi:RloB domain-containing protein [Porphyromonas gingivalis]|uniref:RloB domain-containing protein n=1 Tax=Porphyromonas gingivalis TaxID=837 RepID=UPI0030C8B635